MQPYLDLLRHNRSFRYLWFATVISLLGDWFNTIGTVVLINRYTDSGTAVASLFLARALPPFLLGPIAGVVADRLNRKFIMISTNVLRVFVVLGFLLVDSPSEAWLVYLLTIAQFCLSAFFQPAQSAVVPSLLRSKADILLANTLLSITWSSLLTLGAALGGITAALLGVYTALALDALTFLLAALCLLPITLPSEAPETEKEADTQKSSGWGDFVEGIRYVVSYPAIGMLTLVKGMFQVGSVDIIMAVYAERIFPIGEEGAVTLGVLLSASGFGSVTGPLLANRFTDGTVKSLRRAIAIGYIAVCSAWFIAGWAPLFWIVCAAFFLRSMGASINWTYSNALLQMQVPGNLLGRVFSLDISIFTLALSLSIWFTGQILDAGFDPRQAAYFFGVGSVVPLLVWGVFVWRQERVKEVLAG